MEPTHSPARTAANTVAADQALALQKAINHTFGTDISVFYDPPKGDWVLRIQDPANTAKGTGLKEFLKEKVDTKAEPVSLAWNGIEKKYRVFQTKTLEDILADLEEVRSQKGASLG